MSVGTPCLSIAVARLSQAGTDNFAIWITQSPLPGGYVHHDTPWETALTRYWLAWQEMFSLPEEPHLPFGQEDIAEGVSPQELMALSSEDNYGGRLMQALGINLWQWLFGGSIGQSFAQSQGIAIGQSKPLRIRLDIQDPNLVPLPWEIMQPQTGTQAVSLNSQILFSRTTSNVDPLFPQLPRESLNILLVLGELEEPSEDTDTPSYRPSQQLQLEAEAIRISQVIEKGSPRSTNLRTFSFSVPARVYPLIQPTPTALVEALETGIYNVFFYAGHGKPAPDGGLLFLGGEETMNGTELAQVLVRNRITLAVFNACWGAQPDQMAQRSIERSSLAEVLIHHGIPAVLAMRDSIADAEALEFIAAFTKALTQRLPIDQALRDARQRLLAIYKFNHPAWTLPILYMHPQFDGEIVVPKERDITELPFRDPTLLDAYPMAYLCSLKEREKQWCIQGGLMRVGRRMENDLVLDEPWVSQKHAEIICRETLSSTEDGYTYFLKDFSRFGTFMSTEKGWQKVHRQEVPLQSGVQLKFGSPYGQVLEFVVGEEGL